MAADVGEFLWSEFVSSLEEAESELSGSISIYLSKSINDLISYFKLIRDAVKPKELVPERYSFSKNIPLLYDLNDALAEFRIFANSFSKNIPLLYDLNDALAEFRIFANQCKELLLLNPSKLYFIRSMKGRLIRINQELQTKEVQHKIKKEKREAPRQELRKPKKKVELSATLSSNVFGSDEHSTKIEKVLLEGSSSSAGLTAIGVVGIANAGKTTLVEKVLQSQRVKEKYEPIIWLPFSGINEGEQQFSRFGFQTRIFNETIVGLDKLLERLDQLLSGKKYLIVLDDVWSQHSKIQDRLWRRLPKGSGGAVILTSRLMEVAQNLEPSNLIIAFEKTSKVFRFPEQAKKIEDFLLERSSGSSRADGLTTISVVGIAGRGKTTVVQKALENTRVKGKFGPIIWLPFSGMKEGEHQFSRFGFETCVLDNLGNTLVGRILGLDNLLETLDKMLSGKRYLVVLDDVWNQHSKVQDRLWRRLPRGNGGAVIVTSNSMEVAQKLESTQSSNLNVGLDKTKPVVPWKVVGFDEEAKKMEDMLLQGSSSSSSSAAGLTAIGVVGIAGAGKTSLVEEVLQSHRVKDEYSPIIWVPFSGMKEGEQFSRFGFETCILEERIIGLDKLLERLDQLLSGKKYVIVLDDVWSQHFKIQNRLLRRLPKGSGGAVIVTSRLIEVVQKLELTALIVVEPLMSERCWHIFKNTIEKNEVNLNMSENKTLKNIEEEIKDQCHGLPLAAKTLAEIVPEQIRELESNRFLKEMYIHDELLMPDLDDEPAVYTPTCPVLVFIDMKNEKLGKSLFDMFCYCLNTKQVYRVLEDDSDSKQKVEAKNPETVLKDVYGNLENLKRKGYGFASEIQKGMRILIVGGDAVANWILRVICDLKLPEAPCIVPIPQGTEDHIPISFGWNEFSNDRQSMKSFLVQVINGELMKADSWHILIKMKSTQISIDQQDIPHSLDLVQPGQGGIMQNTDRTWHGGFWNYFGLGVDVARRYGASFFHPTARTLSSLAQVWVKKQDRGRWELLDIPSSINSIVCLNLPNFHGSLKPGRTEDIKKHRKRPLMSSFIDDGFLEIIGQKDVWLAQNEPICLAQVRGIRFKFTESAAECDVSFDGAPLEKKIQLDRITDIEVSYHSQVHILANGDCLAKRSRCDSSQPSAFGENDDDNATRTDYRDPNDKSKKPRFGGAVTFKKHII